MTLKLPPSSQLSEITVSLRDSSSEAAGWHLGARQTLHLRTRDALVTGFMENNTFKTEMLDVNVFKIKPGYDNYSG